MIKGLVVVVRAAVMFKPFDGFVLSVFVELDDQIRHAGIEQLHAVELTDVLRDHHGVHTFYVGTDVHHLCNPAAKVSLAASPHRRQTHSYNSVFGNGKESCRPKTVPHSLSHGAHTGSVDPPSDSPPPHRQRG